MPCAFLIDDSRPSLSALYELLNRSFIPTKSYSQTTTLLRDIGRLQPFVILMSPDGFLRDNAALAHQIRTSSNAVILIYADGELTPDLRDAIKQAHVSDVVLVGNDHVELVKRIWCIVDKTLRVLVAYQEKQALALDDTNHACQQLCPTPQSSQATRARWLCCHRVYLDVRQSYVSFQGKSIHLTKNELILLKFLMQQGGTVVSRSEIQCHIWDSDTFIDDNTLTVNINRLRSALSKIGVPSGFLRTRRGVGYVVAGD